MQAFYAITLLYAVRQKKDPVGGDDWKLRSGHCSLFYALGKKQILQSLLGMVARRKIWNWPKLGAIVQVMKGC
jgi:hypothetical protein